MTFNEILKKNEWSGRRIPMIYYYNLILSYLLSKVNNDLQTI